MSDIASAEGARSKGRLWTHMPVLFVVSLSLLVAAALALTLNLHRLHDSSDWVDHTNDVLRQLADIERALLTAESSERGYLLTGQASYLEAHNSAQAAIAGLLATLQRLVADNPAQTERFARLRLSIDARMAELKQATSLGPSRLSEALAVLSTAQSRQLTPQIELGLVQLRQASERLLQERQDDESRGALRVTILALSLALLAVISAVIGAYYLERRRSLDQMRAANEALSRSEDSLRAILATVPDAMIIIDDKGIIRNFGTVAERVFGYGADEVLGENVKMLMPAPYRERHDGYISRYLDTGEKRIIGVGRVVVGRRKGGSNFPLELSVGEISSDGRRQFVGFVRDLTERQERERLFTELQSELLHVSRLSNMGEMASGLAHELNQPLTALGNYLRGARRLMADSTAERADMVREALENAASQALRAGQVIQRLRDFMARGEPERRVESIGPLIDEAAALALVASKDRAVQLQVDLDPSVDRVLVDKVQIQQVLLNLLRNGIEAMAASEHRRLSVSTRSQAGNMVSVRVADTGSGIDAEVLPRLFQPFVSTKSRGMGIGLSLCRTIINAHGGEISAESNPGGGTIFHFTLQSVPDGVEV